ncbi:MAG: hypothetical protein AAGC57_18840 [Pseudomonadota bacterium]
MRVITRGFLAALLISGAALAQGTDPVAPSDPEIAPSPSERPGFRRAETDDSAEYGEAHRKNRGPAHHRRHRAPEPDRPTLRLSTERDGLTMRFECHAPMAECLTALDKVLSSVQQP